MKVEHSIVINRPLAEVFAFVTDLRNETRWQPEIRSVTLEGPLAPGATFHEQRVTFGRQYDWHFVITRFDPPHEIAIETLHGTAPYRGSRRFEAVPGGTRVTESGELTLPWVLRPFAGLLAWLCRWPLRRAYRRLAAMLERPALHRSERPRIGPTAAQRPSGRAVRSGLGCCLHAPARSRTLPHADDSLRSRSLGASDRDHHRRASSPRRGVVWG